MKRFSVYFIVLVFTLGCLSVTTFANTDDISASIYITIADKGELKVVNEKIVVYDIDNDEAITINDALYTAHESFFDGGAESGYGSVAGGYGISLTKLWGDTSGSYGYYVNNASAWSLTDPVNNGDTVNAFVYKDGAGWSDAYSFFDVTSIKADSGEKFTLTLYQAGYDESWNPVTVPVADAAITVNGEVIEAKTDSEGKVTFAINDGGEYVISAASEEIILVPPVCVATVTEKEETVPGDSTAIINFVAVAAVSILGMVIIINAKRSNEN